MALNIVGGYGLIDDGNAPLYGYIQNPLTSMTEEKVIEYIQTIIDESLLNNIKEEEDELLVNGNKKMYDNFVRSGEYDGKSGNLELEIGQGRTVDIELPSALGADEVKKMFE